MAATPTELLTHAHTTSGPLCANDADGLQIRIDVRGYQPAIDVTQVFAHLRLLGSDPAHWTTEPVG